MSDDTKRGLWDGGPPFTTLTLEQIEQVEQIRRENAALREIVEAVAHPEMTYDFWTCPHCGQQFVWGMGMEGKHTDTCIVTRARELLGKTAEE